MGIKVSDYIVDVIKNENISCVFGYQGGNISHLIDSIGRAEGIEFIANYNEQGSAFAANSYALINETIGVAISSSGPGAINLVSGIANAYFDSIPCLFITGGVNVTSMKLDDSIRQNAFQETDIVSIVKPITKYSVNIMNADDVEMELLKAIDIAKCDRKGPVLLNLPHDIQRSFIEINKSEKQRQQSISFENDIQKFFSLLSDSHRPLIIVGGGLCDSRSRGLLNDFVSTYKIPVVASLRGLDILPHNHDCYCGFVGTYGNRYANLALQHSDLIIALGSRLDDRQFPRFDEEYTSKIKVVHVDVDENELNRVIKETLSIKSTADEFISLVLSNNKQPENYHSWLDIIKKWKLRYPSYKTVSTFEKNEVDVNDFIHTISDFAQKDTIFCADVGINQMCVAQSVDLSHERRLLNSAGLGSMGYSLPAAIGASYAAMQKNRVICIAGDGGIQMNIQELQVATRERLPIAVVILNNSCLGMIRDLQTKLFDNRFYGTVDGFDSPNYELLAEAYGFKYFRVENSSQYEGACKLLAKYERIIVEVVLPQTTATNPQPGEGMFRQYPFLSAQELEQIRREVAYEEI